MSSSDTAIGATRPAIGFVERYLTVWVVLCITGGVFLGQVPPRFLQAIGRMEVAQVNLPVIFAIRLSSGKEFSGHRARFK